MQANRSAGDPAPSSDSPGQPPWSDRVRGLGICDELQLRLEPGQLPWLLDELDAQRVAHDLQATTTPISGLLPDPEQRMRNAFPMTARARIVSGLAFAACVAAGAVVALPAVSPSVAKAPKRCPSANATTLVADRGGRLVSWNDRGVRSWYGCLRGRRPLELDSDAQSTQALDDPRIASPYAAYTNFRASGLGSSTDVILVDLRTGRERSIGGDAASDVTLLRWGAVVFRSEVEGYAPELWLLTFSGRRQLADGAIEPGSVAVNRRGTRVYWMQDGQPSSARLR